MNAKPIPKPRSSIPECPIPAPRILPIQSLPSPRPSSPCDSNHSGKSDDQKSIGSHSSNSEKNLFRHISISSQQLKDELSEKLTLKGKAVISSTRNASIRLEKSVKNLLTKRLTSPNQDEYSIDNVDYDVNKSGKNDERCVSMPAYNEIFRSISFYSPLQANLKSINTEMDLTETRYSPPPPIYPPPPLPDESIYDEVQSTASSSSKYEKSSHVNSIVDYQEKRSSESNRSSDLSEVDSSTANLSRKLSKSISHDLTAGEVRGQRESPDDMELTSNVEEEDSANNEVILRHRPLSSTSASDLSITNSLYENWLPEKSDSNTKIRGTFNIKAQSQSVLFEFDPYAKAEENTYGNYESNDAMLLEALLANNESISSGESTADSCEHNGDTTPDEEIHIHVNNVWNKTVPPVPPKRFDSLPKNEYDEVEMVEAPDEIIGKSPALLPKLVHLVKEKQPAIPPRIPVTKACDNNMNVNVSKKSSAISPKNSTESTTVTPKSSEERKISMIEKIKKFRHDSTSHVRPNVMNFMKSKKLLRSRENSEENEVDSKPLKMERPKISSQIMPICHRGIVYRTGIGMERAKDLVKRAAVLADQKISFYVDKGMTTLKEVIELNKVQSIHLLEDVKSVDGETLHCIALGSDARPGVHVFYAKGITERRIWAQRILEALTPIFPAKYSSELTRAGWAYLKIGVTGTWFSAWILLQRRTLIYTKTLEPTEFEELDLRKTRCILLREQESPTGSDKIPVVVVDTGSIGALHIAASSSREGPAWRHALYQAATCCGPTLDEQQLTQDDVPVILDKCINFIYAHGIMSEGIYRKGGSSSAVIKLLETFRKDAWATQIARSSYSEHDVATVLRRFLRDLPEPLIPSNVHDVLCKAIDIPDDNVRINIYQKTLLSTLNRVSGETLRRILAHLHCLSHQSSRNLMTRENIAAVWGPTLMHAGTNSAEDWNRSETKVISDLIKLYPQLYKLAATDLAKEAKILEVLERHHASNNGLSNAPSGDLKVWIYLHTKNGDCVNVTIGPHKTAGDVCRELSMQARTPPQELCLQECILSDALERPLHHTEKVLETVSRWGYWDSADRKDNMLILKKDRIYRDIVPRIKPPMTISGELKFADTKSKNFKTYLFEFNQSKLFCYKDKACAVKLHEWKIEDIIWYLGHEPKRNPQMGWSITFITKNEKPRKCKEAPFFGYTLAGASIADQYRWLAAMLFGEYQLNLLPAAVNLIDT